MAGDVHPNRRGRRIAKWAAILLLAIPGGLIALVLAIILVGANIGPGQRFIEREAGSLSGGIVALEGFHGTFPQNLHIRHLAVRDTDGAWLTIDALHLAWSPLSLVHKDVNIHALTMDRLAILRQPVSASSTAPSRPSSGKSSLSLRIDLASLHVGRLSIGAALAGVPAEFAIDGRLHVQDLAPLLDGPALDSLPRTDIALELRRLDAPGHISLTSATPRGAINLHLTAQDGADGFITHVGKLPQFDPADLHLDLNGPLRDVALDFGAQAGPVTAAIGGRLDLLGKGVNLAIRAHAPAMTPMPGVGWNNLALDARLHGPMSAPLGQGALDVDALSASGAGVEHLRADFDGQEGADPLATRLHLHLTSQGTRIPGSQPTLLASAPIVADLIAQPNGAGFPITLTVSHPLLQAQTRSHLKPAPQGTIDLTLPDLVPLARLGNVDLHGHGVLHVDYAMPVKASDALTLRLRGDVGLTGGMAQAVGLIGPDGRLALDAAMTTRQHGDKTSRTLDVTQLAVDGQALHLADRATIEVADKTVVTSDGTLSITDLAKVAPSLRGHADLALHAEGPTDDLSARAHLASVFGTNSVPEGPLTLDAAFAHLPGAPSGTITADGTLDRARLALDTAVARDDKGALHVDLRNLSWNSMQGKGALTLPSGAKVPLGDLDIQVRRLADFSNLAGQKLGGHLTLGVHTTQLDPQSPASVAVLLDGALQSTIARVDRINLGGRIADPTDDPDFDLKLATAGLAVQGITGSANATARGKLSGLDVTARAALQNVAGAPASLDTALRLDLPRKEVRVARLAAVAKGEALNLSGPSLVSFGEKTGVDHLRLTVAPPRVSPAIIDLSGTIKPALNLAVRLDNVTPALAKPFAPNLAASGTISGQARVAGTLQKPTGTIALKARGLKMQTGPAASLPAASLDANAVLQGVSARIDAALNAGRRLDLTVRGTVPTGKTGSIGLQANGHVDLAIADAILGAQGRAVAGQLAIDMGVSGSMAAPRATGRIDLHDASFNDYAQGVRLYGINGAITSAGDSVTVDNILAHAGTGTIALNGTIGAFRPGMPLDIHVDSKGAQPIASDLLTATIDTALRIHGQATTRIDVDGNVRIPTATINIPNSMPASVLQLNVIRPGEQQAVSTSSMIIGLDVNVVSPGEFFVRGHGLDAEMMGKLHVGGVSSAPVVDGGFDLRRGNFNLAGVNLNFTHGRVGFNGSGVTHKLDPTLDFRADRNVEGTLASLLVTGYASAPKIDFRSIPEQPRDQVLAMLLFGTTTAKLSTTQLAELAAAVAQLTGGSAFDPLGKVRNALGLDRLAVGGGSGVNNGGASLEAGKYVMKGVYVGAKQATSGSGTQAQVQVDLTRRLKLNTTVGTGGQVTGFTTPENDPGSSVGLSYGFDY